MSYNPTKEAEKFFKGLFFEMYFIKNTLDFTNYNSTGPTRKVIDLYTRF